jgi:hypothetical protein
MALGGEGGLNSILGGGLGLDAGSIGSIASSMPTTLQGPLGGMMVNPLGGAQLDLDAGLQNIGQSLQSSFGGAGVSGLLTLVFGLVYPSLKPLLESGIRRVTVVISWKEGANARDFTLTQYLTNPSAAALISSLAEAGAGDAGVPVNVGGSGAAPGGPVLAPQGMH